MVASCPLSVWWQKHGLCIDGGDGGTHAVTCVAAMLSGYLWLQCGVAVIKSVVQPDRVLETGRTHLILRIRYAIHSTDARICYGLQTCYALSGTDVVCAATRRTQP